MMCAKTYSIPEMKTPRAAVFSRFSPSAVGSARMKESVGGVVEEAAIPQPHTPTLAASGDIRDPRGTA